MTIFHEAARDGNLDILREATRRDCDKADEDGMTPVLWAAYHGNLDALRTLSIRGGNPDKCDYLGNSALHLAAANGHLNCVSYLVSYGSNLWSLDNDFHTPLDVAGLNDRSEIVKFLDSVAATQSMRNKKLVKKFKEKAILSAQKRVKKYSKLQAKAQKKADKDDKRMAAEVREKMMIDNSPHSAPASVYSTLRGERLSKMTLSTQKSTTSDPDPKPYSAHFTINSVNGRRLLGGNVAKKIKDRRDNGTLSPDFKIREQEIDGTKTIKSLSGLKRDSQILYANRNQRERTLSSKPIKSGHTDDVYMNAKNKEDTISRAVSEPDFSNFNEDSGIESNDSTPQEGAGMFERPGFGTVAFINRRTTGALMSLPWKTDRGDEDEEEDDDTEDHDHQSADIPNDVDPQKYENTITNGKASVKSKKSRKGKHSSVRRKGSCTDSIGTLGSLAVRISDVPWDESDVDCLDDDDIIESSPLELFLYACGLTEFFSTFTKEKIDLDALMLLSESDMKDLGLPLGPRKKLADAVAKRRSSMLKPGVIFDTRL